MLSSVSTTTITFSSQRLLVSPGKHSPSVILMNPPLDTVTYPSRTLFIKFEAVSSSQYTYVPGSPINEGSLLPSYWSSGRKCESEPPIPVILYPSFNNRFQAVSACSIASKLSGYVGSLIISIVSILSIFLLRYIQR